MHQKRHRTHINHNNPDQEAARVFEHRLKNHVKENPACEWELDWYKSLTKAVRRSRPLIDQQLENQAAIGQPLCDQLILELARPTQMSELQSPISPALTDAPDSAHEATSSLGGYFPMDVATGEAPSGTGPNEQLAQESSETLDLEPKTPTSADVSSPAIPAPEPQTSKAGDVILSSPFDDAGKPRARTSKFPGAYLASVTSLESGASGGDSGTHTPNPAASAAHLPLSIDEVSPTFNVVPPSPGQTEPTQPLDVFIDLSPDVQPEIKPGLRLVEPTYAGSSGPSSAVSPQVPGAFRSSVYSLESVSSVDDVLDSPASQRTATEVDWTVADRGAHPEAAAGGGVEDGHVDDDAVSVKSDDTIGSPSVPPVAIEEAREPVETPKVDEDVAPEVDEHVPQISEKPEPSAQDEPVTGGTQETPKVQEDVVVPEVGEHVPQTLEKREEPQPEPSARDDVAAPELGEHVAQKNLEPSEKDVQLPEINATSPPPKISQDDLPHGTDVDGPETIPSSSDVTSQPLPAEVTSQSAPRVEPEPEPDTDSVTVPVVESDPVRPSDPPEPSDPPKPSFEIAHAPQNQAPDFPAEPSTQQTDRANPGTPGIKEESKEESTVRHAEPRIEPDTSIVPSAEIVPGPENDPSTSLGDSVETLETGEGAPRSLSGPPEERAESTPQLALPELPLPNAPQLPEISGSGAAIAPEPDNGLPESFGGLPSEADGAVSQTDSVSPGDKAAESVPPAVPEPESSQPSETLEDGAKIGQEPETSLSVPPSVEPAALTTETDGVSQEKPDIVENRQAPSSVPEPAQEPENPPPENGASQDETTDVAESGKPETDELPIETPSPVPQPQDVENSAPQAAPAPPEVHARAVDSVAYSSDNAHIASGSDDKTIRIWDAHTGQTIGERLEPDVATGVPASEPEADPPAHQRQETPWPSGPSEPSAVEVLQESKDHPEPSEPVQADQTPQTSDDVPEPPQAPVEPEVPTPAPAPETVRTTDTESELHQPSGIAEPGTELSKVDETLPPAPTQSDPDTAAQNVEGDSSREDKAATGGEPESDPAPEPPVAPAAAPVPVATLPAPQSEPPAEAPTKTEAKAAEPAASPVLTPSAQLAKEAGVAAQRFTDYGVIDDLDDAIDMYGRVAELMSNGSEQLDPSSYLNLGRMMRVKFEAYNEIADLESAIDNALMKALELVPEGDKLHADVLFELAAALLARYIYDGDGSAAERTEKYCQDAFGSIPLGSKHAAFYSVLSRMHLTRFEYLVNDPDAEQAVTYLERALELEPALADQATYHEDLGRALLARSRAGAPRDDDLNAILNRALEHAERAAALTSPEIVQFPIVNTLLADVLLARYNRSHDRQELDRGLKLLEASVRVVPYIAPEQPWISERLGLGLIARFEADGDAEDLDDAIEFHKNAANLTVFNRYRRRDRFRTLSESFRLKFQRFNDPRDEASANENLERSERAMTVVESA